MVFSVAVSMFLVAPAHDLPPTDQSNLGGFDKVYDDVNV
jgi:hypothetical protein